MSAFGQTPFPSSEVAAPSMKLVEMMRKQAYLASTYETIENDDGTKTIVTYDEDGSVTYSTTGMEGSSVKTVYEDGSSKEVISDTKGQTVTKVFADGSWTKVETNWDGEVITEGNTDGSYTVTVSDSTGSWVEYYDAAGNLVSSEKKAESSTDGQEYTYRKEETKTSDGGLRTVIEENGEVTSDTTTYTNADGTTYSVNNLQALASFYAAQGRMLQF